MVEPAQIVKAVTRTGVVMWITQSRYGGHSFGSRQNAQVFATKAEARAAIDSLPSTFRSAGFTFKIEVID
jgi:hypothetical protein